MSRIIGIPTTRVSDSFVSRRLLSQIQFEQQQLFRIQNAISTGRRFSLPSEEPQAALRGISLQSLLERKTTVRSNLLTSQSYLGATDSAIGNVSGMLADLRASALSVIGTTADATQRESVAIEVDRTLQQLIDTGNQVFRGRYLFAGSKTLVKPFVEGADGIEYRGNERHLLSYSDIDVLFETNVTGQQVFGAISEPVAGSVDVNPILRPETLLTDLHGGLGVRPGSIAISNGASTRFVDISGAATIGDVARLLELNAPAGSRLTARVETHGLVVSLDVGDLSITEVGSGTTAAELGIRRVNVAGPGPIIGADLNPRLTLSTRLDDILATRARAYLTPSGNGNDIVFEATTAGPELNGVAIKLINDAHFQASAGLTAGNEIVTFHETPTAAVASLAFLTTGAPNNDIVLTATSAGEQFNEVQFVFEARAADAAGIQLNYSAGPPRQYTVSVEAGVHSAADLVAAIQQDAINNGGPFTANLDPSADPTNDGSYVFQPTDTNSNAGNTYNTASNANTLAIRIQNGFTTANDVIAKVNAEGTFFANVDISEPGNAGTNILVDSLSDPAAVATTAGGSGTPLDRQSGLQIVNGGRTHTVDLQLAVTVDDLLNAINGLGAGVLAELNATGTGINVRNRLSGSDMYIGENGGTTATQLGIRSLTASTALDDLNYGGGVHRVDGADLRITRRDGVAFDVDLSAGVSASARLNANGTDNALIFSRVEAGPGGNAFAVQVLDSGPGGTNTVAMVGNVLTYAVDLSGGFTAQNAIDLLQADDNLASQFNVALDTAADADNNGSGNLMAMTPVDFVGGQSPAKTISDVLAIINNNPVNIGTGIPLVARLAAFGNGIELVNDGPPGGGDVTVERLNYSEAAIDLGLVPPGAEQNTAGNPGVAASATVVLAGQNNDFTISAAASGERLNGTVVAFVNDGIPGNNNVSWSPATNTLTFNIDPAATTAADLTALVNADPYLRGLFRVQPTSTDQGQPNTGTGVLGVLPATQQLAGGTNQSLTGSDRNPTEVQGVFTALMRLRDALRSNDVLAMERAMEMLDASATQVNFTRSEIGARQLALDTLNVRLDTEEIELKSTLSMEIEVDLVTAVSEMMARQASFEAALQASAMSARMSLLDYL